MDASPLVWEAVTDPAELWRLKPDWDALWRAADGDHVQTERACFHAWNNDGDPPRAASTPLPVGERVASSSSGRSSSGGGMACGPW